MNEDIFALLHSDGYHVITMPAPTRANTVEVKLTNGRHTVELHCITTSDAIGTYYIRFLTHNSS